MEIVTNLHITKKSNNLVQVWFVPNVLCGYLGVLTLQNTSDMCHIFRCVLDQYKFLRIDPKVGVLDAGEKIQLTVVHSNTKHRYPPDNIFFRVNTAVFVGSSDSSESKILKEWNKILKHKKVYAIVPVHFRRYQLQFECVKEQNNAVMKIIDKCGITIDSLDSELKAMKQNSAKINAALASCQSKELLDVNSLPLLQSILQLAAGDFSVDRRTLIKVNDTSQRTVPDMQSQITNIILDHVYGRSKGMDQFFECLPGYYVQETYHRKPQKVLVKKCGEKFLVAKASEGPLRVGDQLVMLGERKVTDAKESMKIIEMPIGREDPLVSLIVRAATENALEEVINTLG